MIDSDFVEREAQSITMTSLLNSKSTVRYLSPWCMCCSALLLLGKVKQLALNGLCRFESSTC